jgi:hypothetical protein
VIVTDEFPPAEEVNLSDTAPPDVPFVPLHVQFVNV